MKKKITKEKLILYIGIAFLLLPISIYGATTLYDAIQVAYDNSKSGTSKTNVQDALDELYARSKDYCPDGYNCKEINKDYMLKSTSLEENALCYSFRTLLLKLYESFEKLKNQSGLNVIISKNLGIEFTDIEAPQNITIFDSDSFVLDVTTIDLSVTGNGKVVVWIEPTVVSYNSSNIYYDITYYISSQTRGQKIYANKSASYMFYEYFDDLFPGYVKFNFDNLDTSQTEDMSYMFAGWSNRLDAVLSELDVSNFDTSKVTDMQNMFQACSSLTTLDLSSFDTSKVTDMSGMFSGCGNLTTLDVSHFDTSKVTDMSGMFSECGNLTTLDVSHFDTSNVTNMSGMFSGTLHLSSIDVSKFDTSKVTDMSFMFYCGALCTSGGEASQTLTEIKGLENWNTSEVTNMQWMFYLRGGLTTLDLSSFDTSNVTIMGGMFESCSSLTTLDISNFNTSKVTDMHDMFRSCTNLSTIYVGLKWSTENVTSSTSMFSNCTKLPNFNSSYVDKTYAYAGDGGYLTLKS